MFKSFKKNHNIDIIVTFKDKIANPDFVKMMLENMEGDIVGFYKKIIMQNIMQNIKQIEDEVEHSINLAIYGEDYKDLIGDYKDLIGDDEVDEVEDTENINDQGDNTGLRKEAIDVSNALQEHVDKGNVLTSLIEGKKTTSGKQTYKYVDGNGNVKELLPNTAIKNGYVPYTAENENN